jgi:Bacterial low temperature requirement A protein (LtrA)
MPDHDAELPASEEAAAPESPERHASWLELVFDLVVIAAVAQLADRRLRGDPSNADVGLCIVLYVAVWLVWTSFMLYANVSATRIRQQSMLLAMAGIAAGLGGLVGQLDGSLPASQRWLVCGGVAAYFLTTGGAGLLAGAPAHWLLGSALPSLAVPLLLGVFGEPLRPASLPWYLAAVVAWQVAYGLVRHRRAEAA